MPRYYFHIRDGVYVDDDEGQDFPNFVEARKQAEKYAVEMAALSITQHQHLNLRHWIEVADDRGENVLSVAFGDVVWIER